jgi:integrase
MILYQKILLSSSKARKRKSKKKPLSTYELYRLENKVFCSERLSLIRDVFVFQCYTGLSYIDAFQLKPSDIRQGIDGRLWIMSCRQKSKAKTDIPLLPKALQIIERYKEHPLCVKRGSVLPVKSNQKMNEYLKEIGTLCNIADTLNTHKARRTFGSTVTLKNGVPLHVVKEMMGHSSVKQTEDYAITEEELISSEMLQLKEKLDSREGSSTIPNPIELLLKLQKEVQVISQRAVESTEKLESTGLSEIKKKLDFIKNILLEDNQLNTALKLNDL